MVTVISRAFAPAPVQFPPFSVPGVVAVGSGSARLYNDTGRALRLRVRASVGGAPAGAALVVDVNVDGVTAFTDQSQRPSIADGAHTSGVVAPTGGLVVAAGSYLTVDVDQVGSVTPGSDLTVQIVAG